MAPPMAPPMAATWTGSSSSSRGFDPSQSLDSWTGRGFSGTDGEPQPDLAKEEFIAELWVRLDRNLSGSIDRMELDCEQFHEVISAAVSPERRGTGGGAHARTELNMRDAVHFCLRKADLNGDKTLSYEEFRAMVMTLQDNDQESADLAFALFDLDCNKRIDKHEFRELCRFFLGHAIKEANFREEWDRLTQGGVNDTSFTKQQYIRWLQTTPMPEINCHAPKKRKQKPVEANMARSGSVQKWLDKPKWNKHLNKGPNPGHVNDGFSIGQREYFMRAQSLPQLSRFFDEFAHTDTFQRHRRALDLPPKQPNTAALLPRCLSSEGGTPLMLPGRHGPSGAMRDHKTGRPAIWEDIFVLPVRFRERDRLGDRPLAPRALFGQAVAEQKNIVSQGSPHGRLASASTSLRASPSRRSTQGSRDPDNSLDVRPSRATTMEPIPW